SEVGAQAHEAWEKTASIIEERGFSSNLSAAQRVFAPSFAKAHPEVVQTMAARTAENVPHAYAAAARALGEYNWTAELSRVQAPTLIVQGLEDSLTPPGGSIKMSRVLPRARPLLVAECCPVVTGHKPAMSS